MVKRLTIELRLTFDQAALLLGLVVGQAEEAERYRERQAVDWRELARLVRQAVAAAREGEDGDLDR